MTLRSVVASLALTCAFAGVSLGAAMQPATDSIKAKTPHATPAPSAPTAPQPTVPTPAERDHGRAMPNYDPVVLSVPRMNAKAIAEMFCDLLPDSVARGLSDPPSVVFVGPPESVARARQVLAELGRVSGESAANDVAVQPVLHQKADDLQNRLISVLSSADLQMAADRERSRLIFRGSKAAIERATSLVRSLDVPRQTVRIEFAFLSARRTDAAVPALPKDFDEVAKDLERFGKLELQGRFSSAAVEGEQFRVQGGYVGLLDALIEGQLMGESSASESRVRVDAQLRLSKPDDPKVSLRFAFNGSVIVPRGEYVVLGLSPCGWDRGDTGILLMQIRK